MADVTVEARHELQYIVSSDPIPSGTQLWEVVNTGTHHSHHVIMNRIPDGVIGADIVAEFGTLFSGTPPAGEPLVAQFPYVGYVALQSGSHTTWNEFDLSPGTHAVICFIIDPSTGMPHVPDGMVATFTVE